MTNTVVPELIAVYKNPEAPEDVRKQIGELIQTSMNVGLIIEVNDLHLMIKLLKSKADHPRLSESDVRNAWQFICAHKDLTPDEAAGIRSTIDRDEGGKGSYACCGHVTGIHSWEKRYPLSEADFTNLVLKASEPINNEYALENTWQAHEFLARRGLLDPSHPTMVELRRRAMTIARSTANPQVASTVLLGMRRGIFTTYLDPSDAKELYDLILQKEDHLAAYRVLHEEVTRSWHGCWVPDEVKERFTSLMRTALAKAVEDEIRLCWAYKAAYRVTR